MKHILNECKAIEGHDGYFVHPDGRVFKVQEIATYENGSGYSQIKLDGGKYTYYVHRLVASAFVPNPNNEKTVDHINNLKHDNRAENLQWMSHGDNVRKSWFMEIPVVHLDGREDVVTNVREFSRKYGLDSSSVSKMLKGKRLKSTGGWSKK